MDGISVSQFLVILAISFPIIWIATFIDLFKSNRQNKVFWILVLMFLNIVGVILYWTLKPKNTAVKDGDSLSKKGTGASHQSNY